MGSCPNQKLSVCPSVLGGLGILSQIKTVCLYNKTVIAAARTARGRQVSQMQQHLSYLRFPVRASVCPTHRSPRQAPHTGEPWKFAPCVKAP